MANWNPNMQCFIDLLNIDSWVVSLSSLLEKQFVVSAGNRSLAPAIGSDTLYVVPKLSIFGVG
jgi:hypothetical protein